jgi:hypothetical protein
VPSAWLVSARGSRPLLAACMMKRIVP